MGEPLVLLIIYSSALLIIWAWIWYTIGKYDRVWGLGDLPVSRYVPYERIKFF